MTLPDITRDCPHCNGTGRSLVGTAHAETLAFLRRHQLSTTSANLARLMGIKPTAMNNRLADLEAMGFLTSIRRGRERIFSLFDPHASGTNP